MGLNTTPRTWTDTEKVAATMLNTEVRDAIKGIQDAWTSYTPTLGGTGWAIGNGTATGGYHRIGKTIFWWAIITFGTTSTAGSSATPTISLPVTRHTGPPHLGTAYYTIGSSIWFVVPVHQSSQVNLYVQGTNGAQTTLTSSVPGSFVAASTTVLQASGVYEAS